jgi:hypothetical protein
MLTIDLIFLIIKFVQLIIIFDDAAINTFSFYLQYYPLLKIHLEWQDLKTIFELFLLLVYYLIVV